MESDVYQALARPLEVPVWPLVRLWLDFELGEYK
jgi:hypothetical protein